MRSFLVILWKLIRPYRAQLMAGVVFGILSGLFAPLLISITVFVYGAIFQTGAPGPHLAWMPDAVQAWMDDVPKTMTQGGPDHPATILLLVSLVPSVFLLRGVFGFFNVYFLQWTAVSAVSDLRIQLFEHILSLSAGFFTKHRTGELISRIINDSAQLQAILASATTVVIKEPFTLLSLGAYLFWQQPRLTFISLLVLPVCMGPIVFFSRKLRHSARVLQSHSAELTDVMTEAFTGHRVLKAYSLESAAAGEFRATTRHYIRHYMRIVRALETPGPLIEFLGAAGIGLVFLYFLFGTAIRPTQDEFLRLIGGIIMLYGPMKSLTRLHNQLQQARAATDRIFELLAVTNSVPEPANPRPLTAAGADILFCNVDFAYDEKPVLRGISLRASPGQLVAIVGASGSGKTTLVNMLLRFYDPTAGAVRIGNLDIRNTTTRELRRQMAVVTQETVLFNTSIFRNIELGRPGASMDQVAAAARQANAHEFIMECPQGYETVIGEKGALLSGGQRQRLAIARAILRDAPILILDEATSALDTHSERLVQSALEKLMQGRTTFCIAHRLSTILHADLIVVLDRGQIVQTGTHETLLRQEGLYRQLHEMQYSARMKM